MTSPRTALLRLRIAASALILALFAVEFGSANATNEQQSNVASSMAQEQYDFLQLCAHFPSLTSCQVAESAPMEKRKSAYMRFGKRDAPEMEEDPMAMEKRKSAYMRFGKRSPAAAGLEEDMAMEKRKSAYMRFGKRKSAYMRFGKRSATDDMDQMEKRKSAYMRFGKRR